MRPQFRDTADHDRLHGIEPEHEGQPYEQCPKHGPWLYQHPTVDECPACYQHRLNQADIEAAEWDRYFNRKHR